MDKKEKRVLLGVIGGLILLTIISLSFISIIGNSWFAPPSGTIAVIPIYGQITYSSSPFMDSHAHPEDIKNFIESANQDVNINAILLEINSQGGTPVASNELMESVKDSKKPVVVWISDSGVSGAYLVASGADHIVANPSSWVGSIGVLIDLVDLSRLYEKEGINRYVIKSGEYKDMGADFRELTPEESEMLQNIVDEQYDYFIEQVAENRDLNKSYVAEIAEGKVYTGTQAENLKLIDNTGSKEEALEIAAELAGIEKYQTVTFARRTPLGAILGSLVSRIGYSMGLGIGENLQASTISNIHP